MAETKKVIHVVAAVICDDLRWPDKIFITQRGYGDFKGKWEFPGGKIEAGETAVQALKREIQEELNIVIRVGKRIDTVEYDYPEFHLSMECFWSEVKVGKIELLEHMNGMWVGMDDMDSQDWLPADVILIDSIKEEMRIRKDFLSIMKKDEKYDIQVDPKAIQQHGKIQAKGKLLCEELNGCSLEDSEEIDRIKKELLPNASGKIAVSPPFHCDYGFNIYAKGFALINYNCVMLDTSPIYLGENVLLGPNVTIACAGHGMKPEQRLSHFTSAPIHIGDNVWIGAGCTVCPGVTIGKGSVIGAGSVVSKDIPDNVLAAGVPCKVIKSL